MLTEASVVVLKANAETKEYCAWLDRCVYFVPEGPITAREVEVDLLCLEASQPWIARPSVCGTYLVQVPQKHRQQLVQEGRSDIGCNKYTFVHGLDKGIVGVVMPKTYWVNITGLPPQWLNIGNVRKLLKSCGHVIELDWYNTKNLDLCYVRAKAVVVTALPPSVNVLLLNGGVEGIVNIKFEIYSGGSRNFSPGPQRIDLVPQIRAVIEEIDVENSNSIKGKGENKIEENSICSLFVKGVMKEIAQRTERNNSAGSFQRMRPLGDVISAHFGLPMFRRHLQGSYNGDGGNGIGWVQPEEITAEVRERYWKLTGRELSIHGVKTNPALYLSSQHHARFIGSGDCPLERTIFSTSCTVFVPRMLDITLLGMSGLIIGFLGPLMMM